MVSSSLRRDFLLRAVEGRKAYMKFWRPDLIRRKLSKSRARGACRVVARWCSICVKSSVMGPSGGLGRLPQTELLPMTTLSIPGSRHGWMSSKPAARGQTSSAWSTPPHGALARGRCGRNEFCKSSLRRRRVPAWLMQPPRAQGWIVAVGMWGGLETTIDGPIDGMGSSRCPLGAATRSLRSRALAFFSQCECFRA